MMAAKDIAKAFNLIKRGELAAFRQVVAGLNINATHKGFGFLHEACRQRQAEMISEILDREDLDLTLREPATDNPPLVVGVENFVDQELAMRMYYDGCAEEVLTSCIESNNLVALRLLVMKTGPEVAIAHPEPLAILCVEARADDILRYLHTQGLCDLWAVDGHIRTAMHWAVLLRRVRETSTLLLVDQTLCGATDADGNLPLHLALKEARHVAIDAIVAALTPHSALDEPNTRGETCRCLMQGRSPTERSPARRGAPAEKIALSQELREFCDHHQLSSDIRGFFLQRKMDLTNVVELAKGRRLATTGLSSESQRLILNAIAPEPAEKPSAAPPTSPPRSWFWVALLSILGGLFFLFKLFEVGVLTFRQVSLNDDFEF